MEDLARVEEVSVIYKGVKALDRVSLAFGKGEFVALIGPSGAGKSTLLRCLNRLIEPAEGRVVFRGQDITHATGAALRHARREIGMIFQNFNLVKRYPVISNALAGRLGYLPTGPTLVGLFPTSDSTHAAQTLERVGLKEKVFEKAANLSGGQQQRVAIARALMQSPALMLADEPVSSLDMATAEVILDLMKRINEKDGVTVIVSLHDVNLAKRYADRIIGLRHGRLVFDAAPDRWTPEAIQNLYWSEP
ncbi:MAG: phosphonate ABC transporter ATP-binding protein [bacterium]